MEYPYGHHHNYRRNDDDDEPRPPPPPFSHYPPPSHQPSYGGGGGAAPYAAYPPPETFPPPPPPPFIGGSYHHHPPPSDDYPPPPPFIGGSFNHHQQPPPSDDYAPPPPPPHVGGSHHGFHPHMPAFMAGHFHSHSGHEDGGGDMSHHSDGSADDILGDLARKPTYRIYCKAGGDRYVVAIRDDKVVMTHSDSSDPTQHWIKDESFSTKVKDEEGYPSFSLVNKSNGQVLKHSVAGHPVQLIPYQPGVFDGSILWTESKNLGGGYRTIRMVSNVRLCLDAFHGDKEHGGVRDGTTLAIYECWKGDNQQWKII